jgi:hypothetical protein
MEIQVLANDIEIQVLASDMELQVLASNMKIRNNNSHNNYVITRDKPTMFN